MNLAGADAWWSPHPGYRTTGADLRATPGTGGATSRLQLLAALCASTLNGRALTQVSGGQVCRSSREAAQAGLAA